MPLVEYAELEKDIGLITLQDPDKLNAMSEEMAEEFAALVESLKSPRSRPRVLILTGSGKAFSAGGRLEMLDKKRALSPAVNKKKMLEFYHAFLSLRSFELPLIAMINGAAVGAGLCVAVACDIRIAARGVKMGFPFARLGLFPGMGASFLLPRLVGEGRAIELLSSGRLFESEEALRIGLVSQVVEPSALLEETKKYAQEVVQSGPRVVRQIVTALRADPKELQRALIREADLQSKSYASQEFAEGIAAAIAKKTPTFTT